MLNQAGLDPNFRLAGGAAQYQHAAQQGAFGGLGTTRATRDLVSLL